MLSTNIEITAATKGYRSHGRHSDTSDEFVARGSAGTRLTT
jgi:hypothetical protein